METKTLLAEVNSKRLDKYLSETTDLTRSRVKSLIDAGQVLLNGEVVKASEPVKAGDEIIIVVPDNKEATVQAENIPIDILYEDDDFAIVNKPQGMTVHIGNGNETGTLVNALLYRLKSLSGIGGVLRPGIVHRIDKDTSGLLVVAKNDKAHVSLSKQIEEKTCHRTYLALLEGIVKDDRGRIETDIARHPTERIKMAVVKDGEGKRAVTDYEVLARYGTEFTLCKFMLQTGRTHQIRVHAKYISHPVVGDPVYGFKKQKFDLNGQLLHAYKLELTHPTTLKRMSFSAPLPDYFSKILELLNKKYGVKEVKY